MPSLATALQPLMAVANAGSFHLALTTGGVTIEQAAWTGVDLAAVQAAVTAAPDDSALLRDQDKIAGIPVWEKAMILTLLDLINVERARHAAAAITPLQFIAAAKTKAGTL